MSPSFAPFSAFGVEIELMIVDATTLDARPVADMILRDPAGGGIVNSLGRGAMTWSNELVLHVLELKTTLPAPDLASLPGLFHAEVTAANEALAGHGSRLLPGAMHPWFDPAAETRLWSHDDQLIYQTFDRIFDCRGHGWSNLQSFHLNLPFDSDDSFRRLHSAIRLVLPLIPALAASSPIADGRPTGLLDTRLETYRHNCDRVPSLTGGVIPDVFRSEDEYQTKVFDRIAADLTDLDPGGILEPEWANARGAIARFDRGSIEIRVGDSQECPRMDLAVIQAVVAILRLLFEESLSPLAAQESVTTAALRRLLDETIRRGPAAVIDSPTLSRALGIAAPCPAGCAMQNLLARVPAAAWHDDVRLLLAHGPLASRILAATGPAPDRVKLASVYSRLADLLASNTPFLP